MDPSPRGRPRRSALRRDAIDTAMLEAFARVAGKRPRSRKGHDQDNVRHAATRVAHLFTDIGAGRGFSAKTIIAVWYDRTPYPRPRMDTEGVDRGNPFRSVARILRGAWPTVTPGAVLTWYVARHAAGAPPLADRFDVVRAYAAEKLCPVK